jgi:RND family efflux transporter MFP subunit
MPERLRLMAAPRVAVLLALGGLLAGLAQGQGRVIRVTTTTAERGAVEQTEWAVGIIETRSSVQVAAEVAGQVRAVLADEGQGVETGAILAEIDTAEYRFSKAGEEAEVRRLESLLRQQERDLARARQLYAERLIAQEQLDSTQSELDALREQLAGARTRVSESQRRLSETQLRAPVTGEVAQRNIDVGDYVQTGTIVFELLDMENLRVRLPFPEYRAPDLRKGQVVRLRSAAAGDQTVTAEITDIRPGVTTASRSVTVIVDFTNPGRWRPGASVRAELVLGVRENSLLLPQVSVVRRPGGDVVYVVEGGVARERRVERGERRGRMIEVLSGLDGGEQVVVDGAGFLTDGTSVDVAGPAS